ncbi:ROK family protein [Clostridium gasigenes]|uniref:ROK family protein n=1 Tax=Clostridium gasigenes TaxID=94869 RepID=UPI001C0D4991|nr:ROK family protein [Clostridium gasigenes]MBU3133124.1 ROK family protein [Clostridium gasigenes]
MANSGTIKNININNIRKVLENNKSMSKSDIVTYTGLSFPTVSKTIEYLVELGELIDVGLNNSSGGRCAKKYSLNPMYVVSLSLYLEGFQICWFLNDFCSNRLESGNLNYEGMILQGIEKVISSIRLRYCQLSSIMIGIASNVNGGKIISHIDYKELEDIDIINYFKKIYGLPISIENDMKVAARGYWARHENKNIQAVASIYMGKSGMGSNMVINGKVWSGTSNFAGELYYLPISDDNEKYPMSGFDGIDIVEYYGKIIQSYIVLINPNLIVLYSNSYIIDKLEQIELYCKSRIPKEAMPNIKISDEFTEDYEYGLSKMANELID